MLTDRFKGWHRLLLALPALFLVAGCSASQPPQVAQGAATPQPEATTPASVAEADTPTETPTPRPTRTPEPTSTEIPTATASPTTRPSATPSATVEPSATPSPTPTVAITPAPEQVTLEGVGHDYQKLNNCGPTTAAMALSFYGSTLTQFDAAPVLKGRQEDKNVSPAELSAYLQDQGFNAPILVDGNLDVIRALVANGVPVIVEQWLERDGDPLTGHYRLVVGYDRPGGTILVNDSYIGPSLGFGAAQFDRWWRAFNRLFIPVYPDEKAPVVAAILESQPQAFTWAEAERTARAELASSPDIYGWFNLGTALTHQERFEEAVEAFDQALAAELPTERMLWYQFEPFEAYNQAGQYERTLALSEPLLEAGIEEVHFYRGQALEGLGRSEEAVADYRQALALRTQYPEAEDALAGLEEG